MNRRNGRNGIARRAGLPAAATAVLVLALQGCLGAPPSGASLAGGQGDGFAWVPFGPAEPGDPNGWYRNLEDGKCSGVTDKENSLLVRALAAVCRAAIEKKQAEWAAAQQLAQQMPGQPQRRTAADDCLDVAGEALLTRALAWHAQHPDADPVVTLPRSGDPVACEFKVSKVEPASGALAGGTPLEITGVGLNDVKSVSVGAATVKVDSSRTEKRNGVTVDILKVTTPAAATAGAVDVAVQNRAGVAVAPSAFTYVSGSASPSTSATPSAPPGTPSTPDSPPAPNRQAPLAPQPGPPGPREPRQPTSPFTPETDPEGPGQVGPS